MTSQSDRRIQRAGELATAFPAAAEILAFYGEIARFQKSVYENLPSDAPDPVAVLAPHWSPFLKLVERTAPEPLVAAARELGRDEAACGQILLSCWSGGDVPEDCTFFARALLQPYAERTRPCPFCQAHPVAGVLRGEGEGASRSLLCLMCARERPFRRIVCPGCGESDKDKLPVYIAAEIDYVRVEACDTCRTYIKSIDLTKNGLAVPEVDEMATVALNLWAEEHGYTKLQANLLGM